MIRKATGRKSIITKIRRDPFSDGLCRDGPADGRRIKRKSVAADLEGRNIYFQEVTLASIEKKAFYTDILLGLVFFFDSRKPPTPPEGSTS